MTKRTDLDQAASASMLDWTLPTLLMLASFCATAWLTLAPQPDRPMLAVFPPWWERTRTLQALIDADGSLVGIGAWPDMLVAGSGPGVARRLRRVGAWLLLDARNSAGCLALVRRHG